MRIEIKALFTGVVALTSISLLAGCPGKLRDPGRFTDGGLGGAGGGATCPDVPTEILAMKCAGSSCHSGNTPAQGLDLVSADVASRVVGKTATECKGPLADPADPEGSVIYVKIAPAATCGSRMPLGAPLSDSEIACVKSWIAGLTPSAATSTGTGTGAGGGGGAGGAGAGGGTSTSTGM
jgi:hypothetical protein